MKIRPTKLSKISFALVTLSLVASACSIPGQSTGGYFGTVTPPAGQVLRYYTGAEPQTLDPQTMVGQPESRIATALFDGLVEYDERTLAPLPSLANSWTPNEQGTVWRFNMRSDARWTDGNPITAYDMVYSWRRAVSPELAAYNASMMYYIRHAEAFNNQSAFVADPRTGRYCTDADLERAGDNGPIECTGEAPMKYGPPEPSGWQEREPGDTDTRTAAEALRGISAPFAATPSEANPVKYLLVPSDEEARTQLIAGDPATNRAGRPRLARFLAGIPSAQFVPATDEHMGVRALDDHTFEIVLEAPTAFIVKTILHQYFRPVPRQAIRRYDNRMWVKQPNIVTSGAFRLVEWSPYDKIVVERNPMFWDNANTRLDRIIFGPSIDEATTAMNMYKAGDIDSMGSNYVPAPWRNLLQQTTQDYVYGPYLTIEYLAIKTTMPPLNDVRVRRALSMAINRQIIADRSPGQEVLTGFTPRMEDYTGVEGTNYNPDEARRLLAEAGFPGGRGFPTIEILYNTAESNRQVMEIVQAMLRRELNIPITLVNQEWRVYLENTRADRLNFGGLARRGWVGDYVDPNTFFELLTSGSTNNGTGWADRRYDQMISRANAVTVPAERQRLLREAETYMLAQQPVIPLVVKSISFMRKPYVRNLEANLLDQHNWRGVWIDHNWQQSGAARTAALGRPLNIVRLAALLPRFIWVI